MTTKKNNSLDYIREQIRTPVEAELLKASKGILDDATHLNQLGGTKKLISTYKISKLAQAIAKAEGG